MIRSHWVLMAAPVFVGIWLYGARKPGAAERHVSAPKPHAKQDRAMKSDAEWKRELTPEQYSVLRRKGTERPFSGEHWNTRVAGTYSCAGCGQVLFASDTKFDAGCGWPSFWKAVAPGTVEFHDDHSHGMQRIEVTCSRCGGHLGHLFDDGPEPTGQRYCINSVSLKFTKAKPEGK